jgi:hypothetical protein
VATTANTEKKKGAKATYKRKAKIARQVGATRRRASFRGGSYKKKSLIRKALGRE